VPKAHETEYEVSLGKRRIEPESSLRRGFSLREIIDRRQLASDGEAAIGIRDAGMGQCVARVEDDRPVEKVQRRAQLLQLQLGQVVAPA
jgi:hypothetical protein